jgi:hypothetical protein
MNARSSARFLPNLLAGVLVLAFPMPGSAQTNYSGVMTVGSIHDSGSGTSAGRTASGSGNRVVHTGSSSYGSIQQGANANLGGVTIVGPGQTGADVTEVEPGVFVVGGGEEWQSGAALQQPQVPTIRTIQTVNSSTGKTREEYYEPSGISHGRVTYRRAKPPVGTVVRELPTDCAKELHGGKQYIRCGNDVYVKQKIHKGSRVYEVVEGP